MEIPRRGLVDPLVNSHKMFLQLYDNLNRFMFEFHQTKILGRGSAHFKHLPTFLMVIGGEDCIKSKYTKREDHFVLSIG